MNKIFQIGERVIWFNGCKDYAGVIIDHKYGNEYSVMLEREKMPVLAFKHELKKRA